LAYAECGLDQSGAEQAAEYVAAGRAILGAIPTLTTVIAERFFDESGGMQLIIHAPFGARINKAWDWRCANVSAAPSILNCRLPQPTTA